MVRRRGTARPGSGSRDDRTGWHGIGSVSKRTLQGSSYGPGQCFGVRCRPHPLPRVVLGEVRGIFLPGARLVIGLIAVGLLGPAPLRRNNNASRNPVVTGLGTRVHAEQPPRSRRHEHDSSCTQPERGDHIERVAFELSGCFGRRFCRRTAHAPADEPVTSGAGFAHAWARWPAKGSRRSPPNPAHRPGRAPTCPARSALRVVVSAQVRPLSLRVERFDHQEANITITHDPGERRSSSPNS